MGFQEGALTAESTTTAPNPRNSAGHAVLSVRGHGRLHDLERLPEGGDLEQVQTRAQQQVGELDGLLLDLRRRGAGHGVAGGGCGHAAACGGAGDKGRTCREK